MSSPPDDPAQLLETDGEALVATEGEALIESELLVEDVSIDGMCGVY